MATVTVTEATRTETVPGPTTPERGSQGDSKHGGVSINWKRGEVALLSPEGSHKRSASVY